MQVKLLRKDDIDLKLASRKLYEQCFDEGKKYFVDYYYDTIIKRNEMIVALDGDEIVSMIHLNPYLYNICGDIRKVHYFVAIATKEEYRNRGYGKKLLAKALYENKNNDMMLLVDIDNYPAIKVYEHCGFVECEYPHYLTAHISKLL